MWKIHRYYLKETGVNALLTFTVLFGIALISLVYKGIRLVQGGSLMDAAMTTLLLAADIIPHLLTFSVMFATVLTFARASQEREITAWRALGVSPRVPMVASLLVGLLCSLLSTWALHYEIPHAHYMKYRVVADFAQKRIQSMIEDNDRIALDKDGVMTWRRRTREEIDGKELDVYHDVAIYSGSGGIASKLTAGSGAVNGKKAMLVIADRVWFDINPERRTVTMATEGLYVPAARTLVGANSSVTINFYEMIRHKTRNAGDRDLSSDALLSEVYRKVHAEPVAAQYTVHRRACFALMPFLLAPIGFCLGVFARERGRVLALSFCMIPLALVYMTDFLGESLLRHFEWTLFGWLPAWVITVLGVPVCWRLLKF